MSNIVKEQQAIVEQDIREQAEVEKKLTKARKKVDQNPVEKKKGQTVSWRPASRLPKVKAPDGFVASWRQNTPERIRQLQEEGWVVANRIEHNMDVQMGSYYKKLNDKPVSEVESSITHNEMICMILPEDLATARKEYHRQETEKQTRSRLKPEESAARQNAALIKAANITSTLELN